MEQVQRAPCFLFEDAIEATRFLAWVTLHLDDMKKAAASKTRHGSLQEVRISLNGNWTYLILGFETGDAAGQNMVTVCTDAVCRYILSASPVKPQHWYVEGNLSGDKKATAASFLFVRGRMVTAEATVKNDLIKKVLHTTAIDMVRYWTVSIVGGIQSGSIGVQGHFANGLAAIFLACGQDIACIAEAAVGVTRMSLTKEGDLYTSITLPNLIVGTVGGGTRFATQRACLAIMDCLGTDKARRFAEVCGAAVLAGEISIIGSLSAGDFSQAHASYGRPRGQ
jgi:hydroxymethylglutaryl-CoA reductase (NADPH)